MKIPAQANLQMLAQPSDCAKARTSDHANTRTGERVNAFPLFRAVTLPP